MRPGDQAIDKTAIRVSTTLCYVYVRLQTPAILVARLVRPIMDGVSSAASIVTVLGLSLQSIKVIYRVVSGVEDGKEAVQHTLYILKSLEDLLQQLITLGTGFESHAHLQVLIQNCAKDLKKFEKKVGKVRMSSSDNKLSRAWTGFKTSLRKNEVTQMGNILQTHVSLLLLQLSILQG